MPINFVDLFDDNSEDILILEDVDSDGNFHSR